MSESQASNQLQQLRNELAVLFPERKDVINGAFAAPPAGLSGGFTSSWENDTITPSPAAFNTEKKFTCQSRNARLSVWLAVGSMVQVPSAAPVRRSPTVVIVPCAEFFSVEKVYSQLAPVERVVIVRTGPSADAHTPTSVALMKQAKCSAIVLAVSAGKTVFPIAVPPM